MAGFGECVECANFGGLEQGLGRTLGGSLFEHQHCATQRLGGRLLSRGWDRGWQCSQRGLHELAESSGQQGRNHGHAESSEYLPHRVLDRRAGTGPGQGQHVLHYCGGRCDDRAHAEPEEEEHDQGKPQRCFHREGRESEERKTHDRKARGHHQFVPEAIDDAGTLRCGQQLPDGEGQKTQASLQRAEFANQLQVERQCEGDAGEGEKGQAHGRQADRVTTIAKQRDVKRAMVAAGF